MCLVMVADVQSTIEDLTAEVSTSDQRSLTESTGFSRPKRIYFP